MDPFDDFPEAWLYATGDNPWPTLMDEREREGLANSDAAGSVRDPGVSDGIPALAERLKRRTFALATGVLRLFREGSPMRYDPGYDVACKQAIRSATSTGANYRAVCRARSDREFYAKLCVVVEECDEAIYWLAVALGTDLPLDKPTARALLAESKELCRVFATSRATMRKRLAA